MKHRDVENENYQVDSLNLEIPGEYHDNEESFGNAGKKPRKKKKKKKFFTAVFTVLLVCVIILFSWVGYVGSYLYPLLWGDLSGDDPTTEKTEKIVTFEKKQFTVLMMGSDARVGEESSRSDTLMIAYVDLEEKIVRLVSIPRDTYITIPGSGEHTKINHAYAYGGVELTEETLKENFDIDIDYTAEVDFQGFVDVIDALGGVTIDVPMRMKYSPEGIDLEPGLQKLDGDQSLQFCRFRNDGQGDLGRVVRQQEFLAALKDQLLSMGAVLKIPDICTAIKNNVVTDLSGAQLLQIMMQLKDGFTLIPLEPPGEGRYKNDISYFFIFEEEGAAFFDAVNHYRPTPQELAEENSDEDGAAVGDDPENTSTEAADEPNN